MTVTSAQRIRVRGVVQGVGFRPFVFRLARAHHLAGWVSNDGDGVDVHVEGSDAAIGWFLRDLASTAPQAAVIASIDVSATRPEGWPEFEIRASQPAGHPTTRISPDLPLCAACERELLDPSNDRVRYPYINCTACGPRFSIVRSLPYDRSRTTMAEWPMCQRCAREYGDPGDRRFHAQPVACPRCGPHYYLRTAHGTQTHGLLDDLAVADVVGRMAVGAVAAIKGIGGYHLACDPGNEAAVALLRERKYRKEQPFAIMARDIDVARRLVVLSPALEELLTSAARPIVLAPKRVELAGVAPDSSRLGIMLPYAPIHTLLFASGELDMLVMTSGNRSSEPIAFADEDAFARLDGIADVWLAGERPIARRLDDSVVAGGPLGPMLLRRSRGYAPGVVARLPAGAPILAVGGDLKNALTLVVGGEAYGGQYNGDLEQHQAFEAFRTAVSDLTAMYDVSLDDLIVAHDRHPGYASTRYAESLPVRRVAVQHHRAHVASVLAERGALDLPVVGVAMDGTGYGDDGAIWGGELFVGSVSGGFDRVASLRSAALPGGDAAARHPVQAAAGFICQLDGSVDLSAPPFEFPVRYAHARRLIAADVRVFRTTSAGRLFDTVAALLGFTRAATFEGQAAMWLEHLAEAAGHQRGYEMPFSAGEIDWRPALREVIRARIGGVDPRCIARAFHVGLARSLAAAIAALRHRYALDTAVLSGGVFQNQLLLGSLVGELRTGSCDVWVNRRVPSNDGGLSLGQAAVAACVR